MSLETKFVADLAAQLTEIPADSILSRTFVKNENVTAILFGFAPGQELSEHTASRPAILHILQGEAHLKLGDAHQEAAAGSWAYMPPRLPHSVQARTAVMMLLLLLGEE